MREARWYLLLSAVGLLPIALSYGINPSVLLPELMDLQFSGTNMAHVFRAVMGLYLGMASLWITGALRGGALLTTALISEVVFMGGLAAGRLLSLAVDGRPGAIFLVYTAAELLLTLWELRCWSRRHEP